MRSAIGPTLRASVLFLCLLLLSCGGGRRPHLILVVIDTLRADHLPMEGYERNTAPFLAGLAADGVYFSRAHAPSSWTAPSTASLLTSLQPPQHGLLTGMLASERLHMPVGRIPEEAVTLAEALKEAGYSTFAVTDNLNICAQEGFDAGFDRFADFRYEGASKVNEALLAWAEEIRAAPASFVYLHYMDPHAPYHPREPWHGRWLRSRSDVQAAYDSEIRYVDEHLRSLLEALDLPGEILIAVTSDHGEAFGEHGDRGHGTSLYQEQVHVPWILSGGDLDPARIEAPVSTVDLAPTLLELAGVEAPESWQGASLAAVARDPGREWTPRPVYAHLFRGDLPADPAGDPLLIRSLRENSWKYVLGNDVKPLLFELERDPAERRPLARSEPARASALHEELLDLEESWTVYAPAETTLGLSPALRAKLRSLGYVR